MPLTVRYHPLLAGFCLFAGALLAFGAFLTGRLHLLGFGAIQTFVGVGFLRSPWYVVHPDRIVVRNLFGMTLQDHRFGSLADLEVDGGTVKLEGKPLRGVGRSVARRADWRAFLGAVERAKTAQAA